MKKRFIKLSLLLLLMLFPIATKAAIGTVSIGGTSLNTGAEKTLTISLSSSNGTIGGADGTITSSNPSCVSVQSVTSPMGSGNMFLAMDMTGAGLTTGGSVKIKAGSSACSTTLSITNSSMTVLTSSGLKEERNLSFTSGTITVNAPVVKDGDSSLKSLSVSGYSLSPSFSSGTKSYSINVPAGTSSVSISASPNSSKASVSGTGNVSLSSDKTTHTVKCTAEN